MHFKASFHNKTFPKHFFSDYEARNQVREENSNDNDSIDQTDNKDQDESSKQMDTDEDLERLRGKIQAYISELLSKTNEDCDNDKQKAEFSQEQRDVIENLVIEFKNLLKRVNVLLIEF